MENNKEILLSTHPMQIQEAVNYIYQRYTNTRTQAENVMIYASTNGSCPIDDFRIVRHDGDGFYSVYAIYPFT